MKKKNLIYVLLLGIMFVLGWFVFQGNGKTNGDGIRRASGVGNEKYDPNNPGFEDNVYPLGMDNSMWDETLSPFNSDNIRSYLQILEDLKSGKINFVWEVWAMRDKCPDNYTPSQCDNTILAFIDANYTGSDREKLKELYTEYFKYEDAIRKWESPEDVEFSEKYELIKEKRRKLLGEEKAELIFGMEEARVTFMEGSQNFIQSTKNMDPDKRVKKFEELKKKTYGQYYENMVQREDRYDHYTTEIQLREKELEGLTGKEREDKLSQLEVKYFGKEKAELISRARKEEKEEEEKIQSLQEREETFLKENPQLSDSEREKKIQELRIQTLGKEEAEMYSRRLQVEKLENPNL